MLLTLNTTYTFIPPIPMKINILNKTSDMII